MKDIPRIITGILFILAGLGVVALLLFKGGDVYTFSGIALFLLIIGIYILQNRKENKIEEIKKTRK